MTDPSARLSTWQSVRAVGESWRLLCVSLLSFASGLPLGLVWIGVPAWMARTGVDIKVIGLFALSQAPWSFKPVWAPLLDRYAIPVLGRRRGHMVLWLMMLAGLHLALAAVSDRPKDVLTIGAICLGIAFASSSFDIAYDAYAVEVLRPEEHGLAVGARNAFYRGAMLVSGGVSITLAASWGWAAVNLALGALYLPFVLVALFAPEPERPSAPLRSLREAVWGPFVSLSSRPRALEILAFVVLYKLSDQLTQALTRPFLVQVGFGDFDVGVATATIGQAAVIFGGFLGGLMTSRLGLGRALWVFGFLQLFSNLGYAVVAQVGVNRPVMYAAQGFELLTSGLGTGAFGVLLLRLTDKRFSATQYALLSSLFSLPRILAGPVAGVAADAMGWRDFFVATVVTGIPGLVMLARFVPWGVRELAFEVAPPSSAPPLSKAALAFRGVAGALASTVTAFGGLAFLQALSRLRVQKTFDLSAELQRILAPATVGEWSALVGIVGLGAVGGLLTAAYAQARRASSASE